MTRPVILASASPARRALLRSSGIDPMVIVSDVDEDAVEAAERSHNPHLAPADLALLLAVAKGEMVAGGPARDLVEGGLPAPLVIACDSVLEVDGVAYGKPGDASTARERWRQMRGRPGVLHTGHWVRDAASGLEVSGTASTVVHFADVDDAEIDGYIATGEPLWVAGGFTLDGLGAPFVSRIEGDPSCVVGLSLPLLRELTRELGVTWWDVAGPSAVPAT